VIPTLFRRRIPRLPARQAYALWADTYPPWPHNALMEAEQAAVSAILQTISARRALDVGTGSGRYLPLLERTGAQLVTGVDFSMPMLTRHAGCGVRVCADACALPFRDGSFDLISSSLMVGDVADLSGWVSEMSRAIAAGGHLVYSDFHPSWADEGWRRTFASAGGRSFELPYFPHAIAEHVARLRDRSFQIDTMLEPRLAGRAAPGARDLPIVVVFHAVKRA
jgi:malonyl-CoA O-methyltransferase